MNKPLNGILVAYLRILATLIFPEAVIALRLGSFPQYEGWCDYHFDHKRIKTHFVYICKKH